MCSMLLIKEKKRERKNRDAACIKLGQNNGTVEILRDTGYKAQNQDVQGKPGRLVTIDRKGQIYNRKEEEMVKTRTKIKPD